MVFHNGLYKIERIINCELRIMNCGEETTKDTKESQEIKN